MSPNLVKYALGIDVSKKNLEVCFVQMDDEQRIKIRATRKFTNQPKGHEELVSWVDKHRKDKELPLQIVLEATGVYHEGITQRLYQQGLKVCLVLPNKTKHYMRALGLRSKNDRIDARGLAHLGAQQHLRAWESISEHIYQIRGLLRHREALLQTRTNLNNQLHAQGYTYAPNKMVVKQLSELLNTLDAQVREAESSIREVTRQDAELYDKVCRIAESIKGMGFLSVLTLVAETNGFALFTNHRQLTAYAGYDVVERQSGQSSGKTRISKQGNSHIRRALHMPALSVVRFETGAFKTFFERIHQRSFIKMKAYVAVQRKLLCLIYTLWKNDTVFDPDYHKSAPITQKQVAPI